MRAKAAALPDPVAPSLMWDVWVRERVGPWMLGWGQRKPCWGFLSREVSHTYTKN